MPANTSAGGCTCQTPALHDQPVNPGRSSLPFTAMTLSWCQNSDQFAPGTLSKNTARTANARSLRTGSTNRRTRRSHAICRTAWQISSRLRTP